MTYVAAQLNPELMKDIPKLLAELPDEYLEELLDNVEWNATIKGWGRTTINYYEGDTKPLEGHPIGEPYHRWSWENSFEREQAMVARRTMNRGGKLRELLYSWPIFAFALFCAAWKRNPEFDEYGWDGETELIPKWKINIINKYGDARVGHICTYKSYPETYNNEYPFLNRNGKFIDLEKTKGGAEELKGYLYRHFINPDGGGLGEMESETEVVEQVYDLTKDGSIKEGSYQIGLYLERGKDNCYYGDGDNIRIIVSEFGSPPLLDEMPVKEGRLRTRSVKPETTTLLSIIHTKYGGDSINRVRPYMVKDALQWLNWLPLILFKPIENQNSFMNWKYPPF